MTLINAKYDGTCDKCKTFIKAGQKVAVEKGKKPLCEKCAPPDSRKTTFGPRPATNPWDMYFAAAIASAAQSCKTVNEVAAKAAAVADAGMKERDKRGIK